MPRSLAGQLISTSPPRSAAEAQGRSAAHTDTDWAKVVSGSNDHTVRIWDPATGASHQPDARAAARCCSSMWRNSRHRDIETLVISGLGLV